jgi:hypothetical protein
VQLCVIIWFTLTLNFWYVKLRPGKTKIMASFFSEVGGWFVFDHMLSRKTFATIHWNKIFCWIYDLGMLLAMTTSKLHLSIQIVCITDVDQHTYRQTSNIWQLICLLTEFSWHQEQVAPFEHMDKTSYSWKSTYPCLILDIPKIRLNALTNLASCFFWGKEGIYTAGQ